MKNQYGNSIYYGKDEDHAIHIFANEIVIIGITLEEAAKKLVKGCIKDNFEYLTKQICVRYHSMSIGLYFIFSENNDLTINISNTDDPAINKTGFKFIIPPFWEELKLLFEMYYQQKYKNNLAFL